MCFSTIIFTITGGWHNRPGAAAVPIASQTKPKQKNKKTWGEEEYILDFDGKTGRKETGGKTLT
jgi:hypothetical protein